MIRAFAISFGFALLALACVALMSWRPMPSLTIERDGLRGRLEVRS